MNLLEETLSDIENCGYATGDVLYVGGEDGRVQMTWEQAEPILDVDYNDDYGLAEIVEDDLNAIRVSYDGDWLIGVFRVFLPSEYAEYAPFKKINIIKEKVSNEQA